ncbi:hypothetical protein AWZ03_014555, partial [Drosophila navojoa]
MTNGNTPGESLNMTSGIVKMPSRNNNNNKQDHRQDNRNRNNSNSNRRRVSQRIHRHRDPLLARDGPRFYNVMRW